MKTFTKFLASLVLAVFMIPAVASAQLTVSQGGTGLTSVTANNILYGVSASLRLGSEAAFTYNPSTNVFTTTYASTTGISGTNGDLSKLTVTYASSTGFTATTGTFTTATGTNLYGFGLSGCNGVGQALTWTGGSFGCGTITSAGDGVSNWQLGGTGYLRPTTTVGISVQSSSTIALLSSTYSTSTNATATNMYATSLRSAGLSVTGLTSALTLTDSTGAFAEYAGSSCTNQFVRSLDAVGAATCATVANTDLANSTVSYGGVSLSLGGSDATPAFNLADATGLPISTGVSGLGTSVATALGVNVGTAGSFVVNGGALGTPSSGTLTNATGLPISTGVSGLGSNVATLLATFSSANLATALTNETGTAGSAVFSASPTFTGTATFANFTATNGTTTNATSTTGWFSSMLRAASSIFTNLTSTNATTTNATTTNLYASGSVNLNSATVKQHMYRSFTWPGTPTTTTATNTIPLGTAYTPEVWNGAECFVTSGTVALSFSTTTNGTNVMTPRTASTTPLRWTLSTFNTLATSQPRYVNAGALTNAQLSCTIDVTVN